ncbi:MAG TPA: imidazoleglycerol-phosphate dehydratase HisB [Spirochaetia bacterium]|nr:imidazoleglycerol-phosphate dehydratase HisB [Spirochaetia bacterium]
MKIDQTIPDRSVEVKRTTKETEISLRLSVEGGEQIIDTPIPFFNHMLTSLAFHGGMGLRLKARGDVDVDPHHLVEDTGIILGDAIARVIQEYGPVRRFGFSVIPMDDALSEVAIDACGRPYLVYTADYPQGTCGEFDVSLVREFLLGLANTARINIHASCRYGYNSHHMVESLFKATGRALKEALTPAERGKTLSTKGSL